MKFFKKILLILSSIFLSLNVYSQGGSNYSLYGIGDLNITPTSTYLGLGGTSIAFPFDNIVNAVNPAVLSKSTQTRLQTGYRFNQHLIEDSKSNILYQNNGKVSGLSTIFVIDTSLGLTFSFGFNPFSNVNYLIRVPILVEYEGLKVDGNSIYKGQGGVSIGYIGATTKILSNLAIGVQALATFGVINNSIETYFYDDNFFYSKNQSDNRFKGFGYRLGLLYEPIDDLFLGTYLEKHNNIEYEKELIYQAELSQDTSFKDIFDLSLPDNFGFGISYLFGKFRVGADYRTYKMKEMNFNEGPVTEFRDMNIFSLGVSRLGNKQINADYFDKVTYNFGISYKQLYYKINNVDIDELYLSFGMNFPFKNTAFIDAALTFGTRGKDQGILVKEYFGRLSIDISIGETWFMPFKREY